MNRSGSSDSRSWRVGTLGRTLGRKDAAHKPPPAQDRERYDPRRFQGQGVTFKGKLIGVLAVGEARGDRMCQDALAELKMAIRAAGEHKQRIVISVSIDGLRLRDERSGDCLYHHPVHKISFIAQDMTDKRAFGYVFGSPDTGHQFFGVKTEKDAGQVVMAMRDLFQVVFELKKQEMEKKKQRIAEDQQRKSGATSSARSSTGKSTSHVTGPTWALGKSALSDSVSGLSVHSGHSVDLLDLQMEIENIEQGISQMDRMSPPMEPAAAHAPSPAPAAAAHPPAAVARGSPAPVRAAAAAAAAADPFGDSFVPSPLLSRRGRTTSSGGSGSGGVPVAIAPPPALAKSRHSSSGSGRGAGTPQPPPSVPSATGTPAHAPVGHAEPDPAPAVDPFDLFTDLDPLGSGKAKPYVDKKDFFSDLKKPKPRLDGLAGEVAPVPPAPAPGPQGRRPLDKQTLMELYESEERRKAENSFGDDFATAVNGNSQGFESSFAESGDHSSAIPAAPVAAAAAQPPAASAVTFSTDFSVFDFDSLRTEAAAAAGGEPEPVRADSPPAFSPPPVPLPPPPGRPRTAASRSGSSSPALLRRGYLKQTSNGSDTTLSEPEPAEPAPEPPPRPALVQPPPLPPKKAPQHVVMKPPPRPPHTEARWDVAPPGSVPPPAPQDAGAAGSPPLPVPARRPRVSREHPDLTRASSLGGAAVHRKAARETASLGFSSLPPLVGETGEAPHPAPPPVNRHTKDRGRSGAPAPAPGPAADEPPAATDTLPQQLQSTSLVDLAAKLHISVKRLGQMSVMELAAHMAATGTAPTLETAAPPAEPPPPPPAEEESQEESPSEEFKSLSPISSPEVSIYKSPQLHRRDLERGAAVRSPAAPLRPVDALSAVSPAATPSPVPPLLETVDEDVFARFDAKFPRSPVDTPNSPDDFHCEFPEPSVAAGHTSPAPAPAPPAAPPPEPEDKYAVFRELEAELTGERHLASAGSAPASDDSEAEPDTLGADPWSAGPSPALSTHKHTFDDDFGASGEPAAADFARFDCEFGATAASSSSAEWPQEEAPAPASAWERPRPGGGSGRSVGSSAGWPRPRAESVQSTQSVQSGQGSETSWEQPARPDPDPGVFNAAAWGRLSGDGDRFEPPPAVRRSAPLHTQHSQFDDDFVTATEERGSLADEVSFEERRRSPAVVDDPFTSTDPWATTSEVPAPAAAPFPAPAVDPFADDEFFQSPEGIQSDPFKQDPFERSWASEFNATHAHQQ
ncbi:protein disabled-like [Amphibalanus amphitrite]|uniref:protein disabled-like n=1 Tax=Amphibalanus amphitrite TaxID=1232801 RepID=UPI001C922298|nr:protein disabled-like [Amphibalanus amphitrite]